MEDSVITLCERLIRDLTNDIVQSVKAGKPFRETIVKRLKFSNDNDWNVLCSLMDLLGDTELAKKNFLKFDLSGPTKIQDYGEQYLRLYGIVNAIYLQKSAIVSFVELVKLNDKKNIVKKIDGLRILELRHIVGAHTVNFNDNGVKNPHQLQRGFIGDRNIRTRDAKGIFKDYNLKDLLIEYNKFTEELLIKATEKFIETVLSDNKTKREECNKRLDAIKAQKKGHLVFYIPNGEHFVIRVVK
jgi:hypothetical protein